MNRIATQPSAIKMDVKSGPRAQVKVWDALVRVFHWTLVISFTTGYLITKKFPLHAYAGYLIFALIVLRVVWGFVGTPYARFSAFTYSPRETWQYIVSALRRGQAREYLSHNPMGALMVYVLLTLLLANACIGTMLYAAQQLEGPLEGIIPVEWDEDLFTVHAIMAKSLLTLASFHVLGVFWATWWHRQNYVMAMLTGYKSVFTRRSKRTSTKTQTAPSPAKPQRRRAR